MGATGNRGFFVEEAASAGAAVRILEAFAFPIGVLAAVVLLLRAAPQSADLYPAIGRYGPYFAFGLALALSMVFKRGRAVFALLSLLLAQVAFRLFLEDRQESIAATAVYGALCVLVPLNLMIFALVPERGALNRYGARRLALLVVEVGAVAAIVLGDHAAIAESLHRPLFVGDVLAGSPTPQLGLAVMALALAGALVAAVTRAAAIEAALAVAVAAFALACNAVGIPEAHVWFTAAGLVVTAGVVHDSYRMAFRDELTGLPGRRALNEKLMGLDGKFALAMLDVDHFKQFNDAWGHDVGDQVLKLVASRLQRVGGGGRAYRYGGEEFCIVFPGVHLLGALSHAEALRRDIAAYSLKVRAAARDRRRAGRGEEAPRRVSVAVSIGVAERNERLPEPGMVCAAADAALYRAKNMGRNRVSH